MASLLVYAAVAFADNVVDDVASTTDGKIVSIANGATSGDIGIKINGAGSDGCDLGASEALDVQINVSNATVAAGTDTTLHAANTLRFTNCQDFQYFTLTSSTEGDHPVTATLTKVGGTTGDFRNQVGFTLRVGAGAADPVNQAPIVSDDAGNVSGDEGSELTNSGAFTDPDSDPLTISKLSGVGSVIEGAVDGEWSWSHTPDDNGSGSVSVQASDGNGGTAADSFDWTANNVAPTITSLTASPANALSGQNVTFTGAATDPSSVDTAEGFQWAFNGGSYGAAHANTYTTSFSTCGSSTVSAVAKDKDGGESASFTSSAVSVYDATILSPLKPGVQNAIKRGQVVPVKISVGCGTTPNSGLTPSVRLAAGDEAANAGLNDPVDSVTTSVSNADTTGVMRETDTPGTYIYNMQIPASAAVNTLYTVVVRPYGQGTASRTALVIIRK